MWNISHIYPRALHFEKRYSRSRSHITTDGQSVNMSRYRAYSGTCDQILLCVRRLFSEICCLVSVVRSLWREVGSILVRTYLVIWPSGSTSRKHQFCVYALPWKRYSFSRNGSLFCFHVPMCNPYEDGRHWLRLITCLPYIAFRRIRTPF
jgi:hypothetical protein